MRLRRFALLVGFVPLVTACPPPDPGTTTTTSVPGSTTTTSSTTSTSTTSTSTSTSTTSTSTTSTSTTSTTTTTVPSGPINRQNRASVQSAYNNRLVPALAVPTGWTGSVAGCNAGTTSAAHQTATLDTVNFFREFVGLTNVSFNATYSAKAQQAALMMQANNQLSHNPPTSWTCYTADGAQAAGSSNIALGTNNGPNAVRLYMIDPGSGNTAAGHRRWVLDPTRLTMGSGTTGNANDLWVFGATQPLPASPATVAWPADGFFPVELEPQGRWSLSIPNANFSAAAITVTDNLGTNYPITKQPVANGYGQNTVVWQVGNLTYGDGQGDRNFTVTVSGITGWTSTSYSYVVKMFDAA